MNSRVLAALVILVISVISVSCSTYVIAGTEACFEVKSSLEPARFASKYTKAFCDPSVDPSAASSVLVAYELTKNLDLQFNDISGTGAGGSRYLVYIPTSDIPGGTLLTMTLSGGVFSVSGNQVYLVKDADEDDGTTTALTAVASSDGLIDGETSITFLTRGGETIAAGTRLALSLVPGGGDIASGVQPIGVRLNNAACTESSSAQTVTLAVTSAITDGGTGYHIFGGKTVAYPIVTASAQFYSFQAGAFSEAQVNLENTDSVGGAIVARTEFVYDVDNTNNQLVAKQYQAIYKTGFYDRGALLDRSVTLEEQDFVNTQFVVPTELFSNIKMVIWNSREASTGTLADQVMLDTGIVFGEFGLSTATAASYATMAADLFTEATSLDDEVNSAPVDSHLYGASYNELFYSVTNTEPTQTMNFNYRVNTYFALNFNDSSKLGHCVKNVKTHVIGANSALLKVPYVMEAEGNFVRITNEHDKAAAVTVDVFGESIDGTEKNRNVIAVALGVIPAHSSAVYLVPDIIAQAVSQKGYLGADGGYLVGELGSNYGFNARRHTLTFNVAAPKGTVNGVSVQKILGGVDRVLPVLELSDGQQ